MTFLSFHYKILWIDFTFLCLNVSGFVRFFLSVRVKFAYIAHSKYQYWACDIVNFWNRRAVAHWYAFYRHVMHHSHFLVTYTARKKVIIEYYFDSYYRSNTTTYLQNHLTFEERVVPFSNLTLSHYISFYGCFPYWRNLNVAMVC